MPKLQELVRSESIERSEYDQEFAKRVSEDIKAIEEMVTESKKSANENGNAMQEIIKETANRVKKELDAERKERETSEDALLSLLEATCTKLTISAKSSS